MTEEAKDPQRQRPVPWQRNLYIMFFVQLMSAVGFSSIFPFLPLYVKSLGSSTGMSVELLSGLVYSSQGVTMMLASPAWGAVADRYGRKLMVERAAFAGAIILLLMAFVRSGEELVILRAIQGLFTGTVAAANALVASQAPRERIGYAMGMLLVGQGAGIAFGPMIGGAAADAFGYGPAFYITAALLLLSGIVVWLGVEEDFSRPVTLRGPRPGLVAGWRAILVSPGVAVTFALRFLSHMGQMMIIPITPLLVVELLQSEALANTYTGLVSGVSSAATTLSALALGRLGDRVGHRWVLLASLTLAGVLFLPQAYAGQPWELLLFQALVGIALGGVIPALSALLARYTQEGQEGMVYGLDNSITSSGRAVAPMLGAAVASLAGLRATFTATGVVFLLTAGLALLGLPPRPASPTPPKKESRRGGGDRCRRLRASLRRPGG